MRKSIMKKATIAIGLLLCFQLTNLTTVKAFAAGKIVVSGKGSVTAKPDIANVQLSVSSVNSNAKMAQDTNSANTNKLIKALKDNGIADKDIQTIGYSIYPNYNYNVQPYKITGYTVSNSISVTIRDFSKVGDILSLAVENGANGTNGINFSVSNYDKFYQEALAKAVGDSKGKAGALANAAGVKLGAPIEISEAGGYSNTPVYAKAESMQAMDSSVPVQSGELTINANVNVVYGY